MITKKRRLNMTNIFISHSQKDKEIIQIFRNAFNGTKVNPILLEYERYSNPPWREIKNRIQSSSALFVLLGQNIKSSDYTQNWISYEVGIADSFNKPIWIFEDINNEILFPIPNVNHYLLYNPVQPESLLYLKTVISSYAVNPLASLGGILLAAAITTNPIAILAAGLIGSKVGIPSKPQGTKLICVYHDCQVTFEFYNNNTQFNCPSCRRPLTRNTF